MDTFPTSIWRSGILLDSFTCVLIAALARGSFGPAAGLIAGLMAACYGPMIFYAAELMEVPYLLFLMTAAVLLLQRTDRMLPYAAAGMLLGLGVCLRPNILPVATALVITAFFVARSIANGAVLAAAIVLLVAPITLANHLVSGQWVLLTASAGHNFYVGHRPGATAGYTLPDSLDGDIFANMKRLAERAEGRSFADHEVSPYYTRKALHHIVADPSAELRLALRKLEAAANDYEAPTYVSYDFQRRISPVLTHALGFGMIFPLAVLGMLRHRRCVWLLVPVLVTFVTIALFFYIARLRIPAVPFLLAFAGAAAVDLWRDLQARSWARVCFAAVLLAVVGIVSNRRLVPVDLSSEWNKVGVVLRVQGRDAEAEEAFMTAQTANPRNPHTYGNLAVLYERLGRTDDAAAMRRAAEAFSDARAEERLVEDLTR